MLLKLLQNSYLAIATNKGFYIYGVDPFLLRYSYGPDLFIEGEPINIVEMLYVTSTVAVVGVNEKGLFSPKRVTFWDTNEESISVGLSFMSDVLEVRLNQSRLFWEKKAR